MHASPVRLIQYFDGMKQNMIPLFQRSYCWDKEKWDNFWDDILELYYFDNEKSHFMGAIVTIPVQTVPVGVIKFLIIDGQQRLITTSIFLCAIREFVSDKKKALINEYLENRHYEDQDNLKIMPTNADRETYLSLIRGEDIIDTNHYINQCFNYFKGKLASNSENEEPFDLEKIFQILINSLEVVMINLVDTDDPYLIYESLNHKGKPLTQGDLVRNYILMRYKHSVEPNGEQEKIYKNTWLPMETSLGDSIEDFLYHYSRRTGNNIGKKSIYNAYRREYQGLESISEISRSLEKMKVLSNFYQKFINPDLESNIEIRKYLSTHLKLNRTVVYPFLMRLFDSYNENILNEKDLIDCLQYLESYVIRRQICHASTNYLRNTFLDLCKKYPHDNIAYWLQYSLSSYSGNLRWPKDDEVRKWLITQEFYGSKIERIVLEAIERSYNHKEPIDFANLSVEHVLPQSITKEWRTMLGTKYENVEEIPPSLVHNIGNLTLTGYNSEMSNFSFGKKKEILSNSHIELNKWIIQQEKWTETEINTRADHLSSIVINIWKKPISIEETINSP